MSTDSVKVGGMTVKSQSFVEMLATPTNSSPVASETLDNVHGDGIWGLGFVAKSGATPLHLNMYKQGKIKQPVFTLYSNP